MPSRTERQGNTRGGPPEPRHDSETRLTGLLHGAQSLAEGHAARDFGPTFEAVRRRLNLVDAEAETDLEIDIEVDVTPSAPPTAPLDLVQAFTRYEAMRKLGLDPSPVMAGRYRFEERINGGGMGVVYRAWDTALACNVALKLLRIRGETAVTLARAEAQAMAQVRHPNVAMVFGFGEDRGQPYIVLEFIQGDTRTITGEPQICPGETLTQWRRRVHPNHALILEKYVDIGHGLAAIHRVSLVHGDFKPGNVLVEPDGRPRVIDFGLATRLGDGAQGGTPEYMALEQTGTPSTTTFASDQYSFCVALFEDLLGAHPYMAQSYEEFAATMRSRGDAVTPDLVRQRYIEEIDRNRRRGPPIWPRQLYRIPRWLRTALERGLHPEPTKRFPDMPALLAVLDRRRAREVGQRRLRNAGLLIGVAGLAAVAVATATDVEPCADMGAPFAEVWRPGQLGGSADAILASYAQAWGQARHEVCAATRIQGEASEALLDTRMQCLNRRKREAGQVVAALQHGRPFAEVNQFLASLEVCLSVDQAKDPVPLGMQDAVEDVARGLTERVYGAEIVGDYPGGLAIADDLVRRAVEIGHRPLLAMSLYQRARLVLADATNVHVQDDGLRRRGDLDLDAAIRLAARAHDDALYIDAALFQLRVQAVHGEPTSLVQHMIADVDPAFAGLTGGARAAHLDVQALAHFQRAQLLPAEQQAGELIRARDTYAQALDLYTPAQPVEKAKLLENLGDVHLALGAIDDARAAYGDAMARWRALGDAGAIVGTLHARDINAALRQDAAVARELCTQALRWLPDAAMSPAERQIVAGRIALACAAAHWDTPDQALEHARTAVSSQLPEGEAVAALEIVLGLLVHSPGIASLQEAEFHAADLVHRVGGLEHLSTIAKVHLAHLWVRLRKFTQAVDLLDPLLIQLQAGGSPLDAVEVHLDLAEAHHAMGRHGASSLLDTADNLLREALEAEPGDARALALMDRHAILERTCSRPPDGRVHRP